MTPEPLPFYRAFEDRFRGSQEMIRKRLAVYLPIVEPLKAFSSEPRILDIGCGRGEWLSLMKEAGFSGLGVDLDEAMLEAARERGLDVICADAIVTMREAEDATYDIVSGFHIAEHLAFGDLQVVMREALRILQPGGLLILETPNPENITVSSINFHLDPTHHNPIPPDLLSFLADHQGFLRAKAVRLQEDPNLVQAPEATLHHVLTGVSPDYALLAQKDGPETVIDAMQPAFDASYGLKLEELTEKFARTYARAITMNEVFNTVQASVTTVHHSVEGVNGTVQTVRHLVEHEVHRHIDIINHQQEMLDQFLNETRRQQEMLQNALAEADALRRRVAHLEQETDRYRNSSSWRVTRPLRAIGSLLAKAKT